MDKDLVLTVIIPTTAEARRGESLERAIQSIRQQANVKTKILLVINGVIYDKNLFKRLQSRKDLKTFYLEEGNLPKAIFFGVKNVQTSFYSFLDDDDCYIPDTLYQRLTPLLSDDTIDFVVSNGFNVINGGDVLRSKNFPDSQSNAAYLILKENWLASSGGIYRKSTIDEHYFKNMPKYLEWTYLGFLLATTKKGVFLGRPAFQIYDSPISLSKNSEYSLGMLKGLKTLIEIAPNELKKETKIKYGKLLHDLSSYYLSNNQIFKSMYFHIASIMFPSGYLYVAYSRHIFLKILQLTLRRAI